jgi:hypothetical protein
MVGLNTPRPTRLTYHDLVLRYTAGRVAPIHGILPLPCARPVPADAFQVQLYELRLLSYTSMKVLSGIRFTINIQRLINILG